VSNARGRPSTFQPLELTAASRSHDRCFRVARLQSGAPWQPAHGVRQPFDASLSALYSPLSIVEFRHPARASFTKHARRRFFIAHRVLRIKSPSRGASGRGVRPGLLIFRTTRAQNAGHPVLGSVLGSVYGTSNLENITHHVIVRRPAGSAPTTRALICLCVAGRSSRKSHRHHDYHQGLPAMRTVSRRCDPLRRNSRDFLERR
jgi:hypothetical protein